MRDRVNVLHMHTRWNSQTDRCVVQDCFHPSLDQLISNTLCITRRDGNHGNLDLVLFYFFSQRGGIIDFKLADLLPDLFWVVIKYHLYMEAAVGKPLIMRQRVSDVTHADN